MKQMLKSAARKLGFEISRVKTGARSEDPGQDPFRVMRHLVAQPNPIIFDVGANVGRIALRFWSLFPDATIHCFEPFPESYSALCSAIGSDTRATAHQLALSDSVGSARLNVNRFRETNSLLPSDQRATPYWGDALETDAEITVRTQTVDAFCKKHSIEKINVLKIDVQGGEYAVLAGAHQMLSHQAIDLIYMEMILARAYVGLRKLPEYLALFESYQYDLFGIYNLAYFEGRLLQTDNIVVSARFLNDK